jgi:arylsulfatase A-like enzyme
VNVVVYVSDALRADHLGCYGARAVDTATIDALARAGARFDQVVTAAPWTAPAMTSIVTGLYPHRHGVLDWGHELPSGSWTLFEAFAEAGYRVGSFVFDDRYLFSRLPAAGVQGRSDDLDGVLDWLRSNAKEPFLLFVHSWATHMPYNVRHADRKEWQSAKREFIARLQENTADGLESCREAYRQAVEYQSETLVASLLSELERLGLAASTMLAFAADHGESWGERFPDKTGIEGVYHLHGAALYDEALLVPLIVHAPGVIEPAMIPAQVRSIDLAPTLAELAGLPAPTVDGTSLMPLLRGEETGDRVALSATSDRAVLSQLAVRSPPWKLIRWLQSGQEEAYRLDVDPRERENRIGEAPGELRELLDRELEGVEATPYSEEEEAIVAARLADLGYL